MRGILEPDHLLIILAVVLVLFGGKKIPELAAGMGKGVREFKRGLEGVGDAMTSAAAAPPAPAPAPLAATTAAAPRVDAPDASAGPKRLLV